MATKNNYTQLVSVRLDNMTLADIDALKRDMQWYSRSAIINNLLTCVLNTADYRTLARMVRYNNERPAGCITIRAAITAGCITYQASITIHE